MASNEYYVYKHVDPATERLLYVGMGKGSRAYATKTVKVKQAAYGHRSPEHSEYLDELLDAGYLPHEWIIFVYRGLEKSEALTKERELIDNSDPMFNRKPGITTLKFNIEGVKELQTLRKHGFSYQKIGKMMGCSAMVVHRILNNKSPRYKEMLSA